MEAFTLLPDPQTNGGLLLSVNEKSADEIREFLRLNNLENFTAPIGRLISRSEKTVLVMP